LTGTAKSRGPEEPLLLREGLWALQVSLAACSAYLLYAAGAALLFAPSVPEAAVPVEEPPAARGRPLADYDVIATRNLFHTLELAPGTAAAEAVTEEIAESQLDVRLLGTIAGGPGQKSYAAVQDNAQLRTQVGVDDLISGARVVRIERDRIILDNQGRLEEVTFPDESSATFASAPAARPALVPRAPNRPPPAESLSQRLRRMAQQAQPEPPAASPLGSLLDQMRMLPSYDVQGGLEGLKVSWVQEGSPVATSGVQVGDLITGMNGVAITSPAEGLRTLRELAPDAPIAIDLSRGGSPVSIVLQATP
jgi:type II secretion system protein C